MTDLIRFYKLGENIGLFLMNTGRIYEKKSFNQETWPQPTSRGGLRSNGTPDEYSKIKPGPLKKYRNTGCRSKVSIKISAMP